MSGPAVASSSAALSRTERVTACSATSPLMTSPKLGPSGLRPRVGFIPKSPQHDAGMRIEPPPSLPCTIGTMPAATTAGDPPLEPQQSPEECQRERRSARKHTPEYLAEKHERS